jgi:ubiquinone/menaquinone biosynthesis C-methylase UbiE
MSTKDRVASHYSAANVLQRINEHLAEQGFDPEHPTLEQLAPYDNFHSRGLTSTLELISLANFQPGDRVLDVGGGLGGPARALAARSDAHVTVLDLTPSFVETGRILTERVGLSDQVDFELGDGTAMPFADKTFDGAWTQHSTMNIEDKAALYAEIHRVLKPGGRLITHEIMAGNGEPVDYPVPWAVSPELSFLLGTRETRALIEASGFRTLLWEDETEKVLAFQAPAQGGQLPDHVARPPGQTILFGPAFQERIRTLGNNLRSGKLAVIRALFERTR